MRRNLFPTNLVDLNVVPAQTFLVRKLFTCVAKQTNQLDMLSFFVLRHLSLACGSEVALFAGELLNQFFNLCKRCCYEEIVLSCTFVIGSIILFRHQIQNKISKDKSSPPPSVQCEQSPCERRSHPPWTGRDRGHTKRGLFHIRLLLALAFH